MRGSLSSSNRSAVWLAAVALWLPAGSCLAQENPASVPQSPWPQQIRVGEYWIGLVSEPIHEALRAQLNLPEDQGLLVEQIAPDSPAAAAALQRYDVLLKADGKLLARVQDLVVAIDAVKGKKMELEVLRTGKRLKLDITPVKRPLRDFTPLAPPMSGADWQEAIRKWAEQVQRGEPLSHDYSFLFVRPGVVLGRPGAVADLPGNVTVSITKQGKTPTKIVVTRDSQKWELNEGEVHKLPADLRAHVEAMLPHPLRGALSPRFEGRLLPPAADVLGPNAARGEHHPGRHVSAEPSKPIDKQLEEMSRRLDEMRKAVEAIKQNPSQSPPLPEVNPAPSVETPKADAPR